MLVDLALISVGLYIAIPVCAAVYPQYSRIEVKDLDEDLRKTIDPKLDHLVYNKGLWLPDTEVI